MRYHDYMIFGAHGVYCGLCYGSPLECRCTDAFLRVLTDARDALAVPPAPALRLCPHCGQPMPASTPAAPAPTSTARDVLQHAGSITDPTFDPGTPATPRATRDANVTDEPPPSGYMSREKML